MSYQQHGKQQPNVRKIKHPQTQTQIW